MTKKLFALLFCLLLLPALSYAEEIAYDDSFEDIAGEDIYEGVGAVQIRGDAGMAPDSAFYFVETLVEDILVGSDPETALEYKEEKLLEAKKMIEAGNNKAAEKALKRVEKYNGIIQKEVGPDLEGRVRETSKATKELLGSFGPEIEGDEWGGVREIIDSGLKSEDKIALAAKVSKKIKDLCEVLSELDPMEYSKMCRTDDASPKWKKDLDKKLTKEQEKEAQQFFTIMSECFQNPAACRCGDISVKPFAEKCSIIAPLAARCEAGDEGACSEMEDVEDPINLLPDYLQGVMVDAGDKYGKAKYDLHVPEECAKEGAVSREACMNVMFRLNAPPECQKALESGKINPTNEMEAKKACDEIMFALDAPEECIKAGLRDFRECDRHMFRLDAPQECIDAGLMGSGKDDWKKCGIIRFKLDSPKECLDAGLTGEGKDDWKKCDVIRFRLDAPKECIDAGITGSGRDDWKKCDLIRFKLEAPEECIAAGLTGSGKDDWKKCEAIRFRNEAHPACISAGLTGSGQNDWKKCQVIQFKAEAAEECIAAGLTGEGKDDWRKCDAIRFRSEAHPSCIAAGLTGEGRDDWKKCQVIQFKAEAPPECISAGLDGSGRDDWDKCNRMRKQNENQGPRREDCRSGQLHICEGGYCRCEDPKMPVNTPTPGCTSPDCQQSRPCETGNCTPGNTYIESECRDGCLDECPGADRTDCVNGKCVCYNDATEPEQSTGQSPAEPAPEPSEPALEQAPLQPEPAPAEAAPEPAPAPEPEPAQ